MSKGIRRLVSTVFGIVSVGLLLFAAIRFPDYYCSYTDNNSLNHMVTTDIQIQTYETAYTSFAEKIHALAQAMGNRANLSAVRMNNEADVSPGRKELTRIVRTELKKMKEHMVIPTAYKPKARNMTVCERYTIYATNQYDKMKGISCWKLEYESKNRITTVYLDEEYHKIYQLNVLFKISTDREGVTTYDDNTSVEISKLVSKEIYLWWNGIINYYDLNTYPGFFDNGLENLGVDNFHSSGTIEFSDIMDVISICRFVDSLPEGDSLNVGFFFNKMIQF